MEHKSSVHWHTYICIYNPCKDQTFILLWFKLIWLFSLSSTQECFTYVMVASIMVWWNRAGVGGSPWPSVGCWETLGLTAGEEARISWSCIHGVERGSQIIALGKHNNQLSHRSPFIFYNKNWWWINVHCLWYKLFFPNRVPALQISHQKP